MENDIWSIVSPKLTANASNTAWIRRVRQGDPVLYSYDKIYKSAISIAATLRQKGISQGDIVSVCAANGPEWGSAALAVFKLGAILAPIHHGYSKEDMARQIDALAPKVILTHEFNIEDCDVEMLSIELSEAGNEEEARIKDNISKKSEAVRIYTSGSTGKPKMVRLSHSTVGSNLITCSNIVVLGKEDRFLSLLPLSHMFELLGGMLLPLYNGCSIVLPSVLTAAEVLEAMKAEEVSIVLAVPRLYRSIKEGMEKKFKEAPAPLRWYIALLASMPLSWRKHLNAPIRKKLSPKLRIWVSGGARLDPSVASFYRSLGINLRQGYGLTETGPVISVQEDYPTNLDSVGKPLENVEVIIDDPDQVGCGEILVKGPNIMMGYTDPELTAEVMRDDWFCTGDVGRIDASGNISITGRIKRLIVTEAGKNVYPEEIEMLIERYDDIKEAAVLEVDSRPAAVLAIEKDMQSIARSVIEKFNKQTSSHNQIARFAVVEDLPKTPLGKIAISKLPEIFAESEVKG